MENLQSAQNKQGVLRPHEHHLLGTKLENSILRQLAPYIMHNNQSRQSVVCAVLEGDGTTGIWHLHKTKLTTVFKYSAHIFALLIEVRLPQPDHTALAIKKWAKLSAPNSSSSRARKTAAYVLPRFSDDSRAKMIACASSHDLRTGALNRVGTIPEGMTAISALAQLLTLID